MKLFNFHTFTLRMAVPALMVMALVTACDNDPYAREDGSNMPSGINGLSFTNQLSAGKAANLALTYSGDTLIGKTVAFTDKNGHTSLNMNYVLPHEAVTTIGDIVLQPDGKDGYTFQGTATSPLKTTFTYSGKLTPDHTLALDLSNIQLPVQGPGKLSTIAYKAPDQLSVEGGQGFYYHNHGSVLVSIDNAKLSMLLPYLEMFTSQLLPYILKDVTFAPDGNITATYAPLPADFDFAKFILGQYTIDRKDSDWKTSPINLATYFIEGDTTLYATPNADMIVRQIQKDKPLTRALPDTLGITKVLEQVTRWSTTGVQLTLLNNPYRDKFLDGANPNAASNIHTRYDGDYLVYIDKGELQPVLELTNKLLTPQVIEIIVEKVAQQTGAGASIIKPMVQTMLQEVKNLDKSRYMKIGLLLNK